MNLDELRVEIDSLDKELVELFKRRMEVCAQVAKAKQESGKMEGTLYIDRAFLTEHATSLPTDASLFLN